MELKKVLQYVTLAAGAVLSAASGFDSSSAALAETPALTYTMPSASSPAPKQNEQKQEAKEQRKELSDIVHSSFEADFRYNLFTAGPKGRDGKEEFSKKLSFPTTFDLSQDWKLVLAPTLRFTDTNIEPSLFSNEQYGNHNNIHFSLDQIELDFAKGPLTMKFGKMEPFTVSDKVLYDQDLRPVGIAASYTFDKESLKGLLDSATVRGALYFAQDSYMPSDTAQMIEVQLTKKFGPVKSDSIAGLKHVTDVHGKNVKWDDYRTVFLDQKITWSTGNKFLSTVQFGGNYAANLAAPDNHAAAVTGTLGFFDGALQLKAGYMDRRNANLTVPSATFYDDIVRVGYGPMYGFELQVKKLPHMEKVPVVLGVEFHNPTVTSGRKDVEVQRWQVYVKIVDVKW